MGRPDGSVTRPEMRARAAISPLAVRAAGAKSGPRRSGVAGPATRSAAVPAGGRLPRSQNTRPSNSSVATTPTPTLRRMQRV
jgi:hypothetical protein